MACLVVDNEYEAVEPKVCMVSKMTSITNAKKAG
jgi:hypothetical protein